MPDQGCEHCEYGWITIQVDTSKVYGDGAKSPAVCRCLCAVGQSHGVSIPTIAEVMPAEVVVEMWPDGAPTVAGMSDRLGAVGIPRDCWGWSIDSFTKKFGRDAVVKEYLQLAKDWLRAGAASRTDIVLYGPNGTGKTGLAISLLRAAVKAGERPVQFVRGDRMSIEWRDTYRKDSGTSELSVLAGFEQQKILVVDEVGGSTEFREQMLTMVVDARQKAQRPTILTLNVGQGEANARVLAEQLGPTLYDRLREKAQFWPMEGRSRRSTLASPSLAEGDE